MKSRTLLWLLVTWLAFGSVFVAIKIGVGYLPPLVLATLRFALAGPILLLFALRLHHEQPDPSVRDRYCFRWRWDSSWRSSTAW
ncbi:MAG: EamA family transporter [Candidatus Eremiobacteraeota bacterium]|nr:EamA family transporter [Candidatus Eremiobacteraeota bacterium]